MQEKKKIAVIGAKGFPAWGGAARSNEAICLRLKSTFNITVFALSSHADLENYEGIRQIIFKSCRNKKISTLSYYLKFLIHVLFKENYDLIHVNHLYAGFLVPILRIKYPVVLNVLGFLSKEDRKWNFGEKKILNFFGILGLKFANIIITVEKYSVNKLRKLSRNEVVFIPNGVDNNFVEICSSEQKEYDITFSAARIIYIKGLHILLRALKKINFKGNLQIIGDLGHEKYYKNMIQPLCANLNCDLMGIIKNKAQLFKKIENSKLFIFPSYSEGMSNMLLEVASLKIPIIASDIVQNKEVFDDSEVLFFHIDEDGINLSRKIEYALIHMSDMNDKAEKAYNKILKNNNWDFIAQEYKIIYNSILYKRDIV